MWKQKLCLAISDGFGASEEEQIALFKKIGFDGFFCMYEEGKDLVKLKILADKLDMYFQSVHAPYVNTAHMWKRDEKTDDTLTELLHCVEEASRAEVRIVVLHAFCGFEEHTPTRSGLDNFRLLVNKAKECNVKLAFENTEGEEYLAALMREFKNEAHVGFCWDTGHELCYNHGNDMTALYGDRLFCTHLNDNLGIRDFKGEITWIDDLHLLPFDGIADWRGIAERLCRCGFDGELTFELNKKSKPDRCENDVYDEMTLRRYITEAYKRACRFASMREFASIGMKKN